MFAWGTLVLGGVLLLVVVPWYFDAVPCYLDIVPWYLEEVTKY